MEFGVEARGLRFRLEGLGAVFMVCGLGFGVYGSGLRVWGLGFKV